MVPKERQWQTVFLRSTPSVCGGWSAQAFSSFLSSVSISPRPNLFNCCSNLARASSGRETASKAPVMSERLCFPSSLCTDVRVWKAASLVGLRKCVEDYTCKFPHSQCQNLIVSPILPCQSCFANYYCKQTTMVLPW